MTEWHRQWQECFSEQYREIVHKDPETGEKHIADIKIPIAGKELVIEFQNSPISAKEIQSREHFYKDMIWVVNGETYPLKIGGWKNIRHQIESGYYVPSKKKEHIDFLNSITDEYFDYLIDINDKTINYSCKKMFFIEAEKPIYIDIGNNEILFFKNVSYRKIYIKSEIDDDAEYLKIKRTFSFGAEITHRELFKCTKEQFLKTFAK